MNAAKHGIALGMILLLLAGCGGAKSAPKEGVVYLDPNAAPAATASAAAQAPREKTTADPAAAQATEGGAAEGALDLHFAYRDVVMAPMMEAAPVLAALGEPLHSFEADSCAYQGKDLFYAYPGLELTVNEVEGAERITVLRVTDDTVTIPQGLRIYDEEEKLLSTLGGTGDDGVYTYTSGQTELLVATKVTEDGVRRIWSIEYRAAGNP